MKRKAQLVPFPLGATVLFWVGIGYLGWTVYQRFPVVVAAVLRFVQ